jgi:hypothetical protein
VNLLAVDLLDMRGLRGAGLDGLWSAAAAGRISGACEITELMVDLEAIMVMAMVQRVLRLGQSTICGTILPLLFSEGLIIFLCFRMANCEDSNSHSLH